MSMRKRFLSLLVLAVFACFAGVAKLPAVSFHHWLQTARAQKNQQQKQGQARPAKPVNERERLAKKPVPSGTLAQRLDKDDGYALVLFYSGDVRGNLEVCGCPIYPLGGVARRMGYINAFKKRSPDAAFVLADVGRIFADEHTLGASRLTPDVRLTPDAQLMNEWMVRATNVMQLEIVNLSYHDLLYAGELLKPDAPVKAERAALLSANAKVTDATRENPAPYVIKTVSGKRLKAPIRIAFIGLSDLPPEGLKAQVEASGFIIHDPLKAAQAALAEVRDKADVTVVVGYLKRSTATKLAQQNDDLDIILNSDGSGITLDPLQINNTLLLYATKETKHLGELRFYLDATGVVERFTNRYVEMDEIIPDDAQLAHLTRQARQELDVLQTRLAEDAATALAAQIAREGAPATPYVTAEGCAKCHAAEYESWRKTRHANAFAALATRKRIYDSACVGCHSVGYQQQGFLNIKATPQFANVQCESCHGPGAAHAAKPVKGNYVTPATPAGCVTCHDRDNSPDFVFAKYWRLVAHGPTSTKLPGTQRAVIPIKTQEK